MRKKFFVALLALTVLLAGAVTGAFGVPGYLASFVSTYNKAGSVLNTCGLCHINPAGGGARNPYGLAFAAAGYNFQAIEQKDSDGDGFTNIVEINANTFPGNASSHPAATPTPTPTPIPTPTPASGMPVPTGQNQFPFAGIASPVTSADRSASMPFGVGPIATGGATVEVTAALRESMSFVDIYVAFSVSTDPGNLHILNPDGSLQVVPFSMVLQSIVNGTLPPGIGPWIGNTMNSINAVLLGSTPVSQIPPGTYSIYLMRAAAGSLANFDIYSTGFTVPDGTALYAQNCQGCHGALATSSVRGESASNISAAINGGVSQMSGLRSLLSLQVQAIATALQ